MTTAEILAHSLSNFHCQYTDRHELIIYAMHHPGLWGENFIYERVGLLIGNFELLGWPTIFWALKETMFKRYWIISSRETLTRLPWLQNGLHKNTLCETKIWILHPGCVSEREWTIWQFVIIKKKQIWHQFFMLLSYCWISSQHCHSNLVCGSTQLSPWGSTDTLTMSWWNSWSITGQMHDKTDINLLDRLSPLTIYLVSSLLLTVVTHFMAFSWVPGLSKMSANQTSPTRLLFLTVRQHSIKILQTCWKKMWRLQW